MLKTGVQGVTLQSMQLSTALITLKSALGMQQLVRVREHSRHASSSIGSMETVNMKKKISAISIYVVYHEQESKAVEYMLQGLKAGNRLGFEVALI